jgi:DNA-binding YbaB/EbfC family protein
MANFGNLGGMGGMGGIMKQAQRMMEQAKKAEEELAAARVEGSSGGGMVKVEATGTGEILAVTIDPEVVDPEDVEMLQDLVVTAVRDALDKSTEMRADRMKDLTGGLNIPGLKL